MRKKCSRQGNQGYYCRCRWRSSSWMSAASRWRCAAGWSPEAGPRALLRAGGWGVGADWDRPGPRMGRFELSAARTMKAAGLGDFRLWNIARDPGQTTDLAAEEPARLRQLEEQLVELHGEVIAEAVHGWFARPESRELVGRRFKARASRVTMRDAPGRPRGGAAAIRRSMA